MSVVSRIRLRGSWATGRDCDPLPSVIFAGLCLRLTAESYHRVKDGLADGPPVREQGTRIGVLHCLAVVILIKLAGDVERAGSACQPRRGGEKEVWSHVSRLACPDRSWGLPQKADDFFDGPDMFRHA